MLALTVGLPGSGKSTLLERLDLPASWAVVSADRVRADLFGVVFDPAVEPCVWRIVRALVEGHLRLGRDVLLDATSLTAAGRGSWIRCARRFGRPAVAIYLDVPFEEVLRRNRLRPDGRVLDEALLARKRASLEPPTGKEGFRGIITVGGAAAADVEEVRRKLAALETTHERRDYHGEAASAGDRPHPAPSGRLPRDPAAGASPGRREGDGRPLLRRPHGPVHRAGGPGDRPRGQTRRPAGG